jgi:putative exosortase-associated protein (TIGR04073 family)
LKRSLFAILTVVAIVIAGRPADAQTASEKFGRGLAAMTCGFLELPGNIVEQTEKRGAVGVPIGIGYGLGMLVTRELVGVYEFLTAPFPAPEGYRPILSPEYPWDYFK